MQELIDIPDGYKVAFYKRRAKRGQEIDQDWIDKNRPNFAGIDMDHEWTKAKDWCVRHGQPCTQKFMLNWLAGIDPVYYRQRRQEELSTEAEQIKDRGYTDALGIWQPATEADGRRLKELRELFKRL